MSDVKPAENIAVTRAPASGTGAGVGDVKTTAAASGFKRPAELTYAVDEWPPLPRLILLGFQFAVLTAIYLVLVVIIVRHAHVSPETAADVVGMALIALAIATVLQALHVGPIGSGFLAPPVYSAIYLAPSVLAAEAGGLPAVFGMTIFAASTEFLLALLFRQLRIIFQPILGGLTVLIVGLQSV
jgi:xanthine permease XanP